MHLHVVVSGQLSQQETSVRQAANWKEELKAAQLK